MPARLEITGEVARIILTGNLDFSTQDDLRDVMDRAISNTTTKEIYVDMAETTFIDSSIIRSLLNLQELAHASKKSLSIWNCNTQIREIFAIGGFDQLFVIR